MKFSERFGFVSLRDQLQVKSMDADLRNRLWSLFYSSVMERKFSSYNLSQEDLTKYLWTDYLKRPIDLAPSHNGIVQFFYCAMIIRDYVISEPWYKLYELIEIALPFFSSDFAIVANVILDQEKSGYRLVNEKFVAITSESEIREIEDAIKNQDQIGEHLRTALKLYAD